MSGVGAGDLLVGLALPLRLTLFPVDRVRTEPDGGRTVRCCKEPPRDSGRQGRTYLKTQGSPPISSVPGDGAAGSVSPRHTSTNGARCSDGKQPVTQEPLGVRSLSQCTMQPARPRVSAAVGPEVAKSGRCWVRDMGTGRLGRGSGQQEAGAARERMWGLQVGASTPHGRGRQGPWEQLSLLSRLVSQTLTPQRSIQSPVTRLWAPPPDCTGAATTEGPHEPWGLETLPWGQHTRLAGPEGLGQRGKWTVHNPVALPRV